MDVGAVLRLQTNLALHVYGERRCLPFSINLGTPMNFQGTESIEGHLGGWNPSVECTNALVRPGSVFITWLMPPGHVIGAMAGNDQALDALHTTNMVEMPEAGASALQSLYQAALAGGDAKAEDVLIEFQSAVLGGGESLEFDPDDRPALVRAVNYVMNNLHTDMDGRDLAREALTHEGNLRKHFKRYGTSPMAFKRYAELCHLGRFARTEEGRQMTQQQLADRFGYAKPKYMAEVYKKHTRLSLPDVQRGQIELL